MGFHVGNTVEEARHVRPNTTAVEKRSLGTIKHCCCAGQLSPSVRDSSPHTAYPYHDILVSVALVHLPRPSNQFEVQRQVIVLDISSHFATNRPGRSGSWPRRLPFFSPGHSARRPIGWRGKHRDTVSGKRGRECHRVHDAEWRYRTWPTCQNSVKTVLKHCPLLWRNRRRLKRHVTSSMRTKGRKRPLLQYFLSHF